MSEENNPLSNASVTINNYPYMKPFYYFCEEENCIGFSYYENTEDLEFLIDIKDFLDVLNSGKKFIFDVDSVYPSYKSNNKIVTILENIYKFDYMSSNYIFLLIIK